MKETYQQPFVAFPVHESPLLDYLKKLNSHKKFTHLSIYFLDQLDDEKLIKIKETILSNTELFNNTVLIPLGLDTVGIHGKTFVLKIENTDKLKGVRAFFENHFPNKSPDNLSFLPHISIYKDYRRGGKLRLPKTSDLNSNVKPYHPGSVGIYYRTEENATALLFSHKI